MPRKPEERPRVCPRCFVWWGTEHECLNATRHVKTERRSSGLRIEMREHVDCGGRVLIDVDGMEPGR
jgi:hypothetical protein